MLIKKLDDSSALMVYQQLTRDKHMHKNSVDKKLVQIRNVDRSVYICAYREDDLAFLFVSKKKGLYEEIQVLLGHYHANSKQEYKSLHS